MIVFTQLISNLNKSNFKQSFTTVSFLYFKKLFNSSTDLNDNSANRFYFIIKNYFIGIFRVYSYSLKNNIRISKIATIETLIKLFF